MGEYFGLWLIHAFVCIPSYGRTQSPNGTGLAYLNVTEFDSPEEMQIESDEGGQEGRDDGDGSTASTDGTGSERMTDDDVALDGDGDDEPDRVVTDRVQRRGRQLA